MAPRYIESDEDTCRLIAHLREKTPLSALNFVEASAVFRCLAQLGYRIQKPHQHPSGLETTEEAITTVEPLPAAKALGISPTQDCKFKEKTT
jgi:hypothetical protein